MKKIPKLALAIATSCTIFMSFLSSQPVSAIGECNRTFLGMPSWDCGISEITGDDTEKNQATLISNVVIIAANVLTILLIASSYLVLGYVIYGGYQYILSNGDSGKVAAGKKTILHALIGLAIVMLSSLILGAIRIALGNQDLSKNCTIEGKCYNLTDASSIAESLLGWVIGISGLVCVIFIIIGGIGYITSAGDPSKTKDAKEIIKNALIGLAIVALSSIITAFASNLIRNAKTADNATTPQSFHQITIAKE